MSGNSDDNEIEKLTQAYFQNGFSLLMDLFAKKKLPDERQQSTAEFILTASNHPDFIYALEVALVQSEYTEHHLQQNPSLLEVIDFCLDIAFRSRHLHRLQMDGLLTIQKKFKDSLPFEDNEKISLQEYAVLHDLAALKKLFNKLETDFLSQHSGLVEFYQKINLCAHIEKRVEMKIRVDYNSQSSMLRPHQKLLRANPIAYFNSLMTHPIIRIADRNEPEFNPRRP